MDFVRVDLDGIDHEFGVPETVISEPNSHGSQGRSSMKQGGEPFEQLMQTNLSAQSSPFPETENLSLSSLTKPVALHTSATQLSFQSSKASGSSNVDLHAVRGPFTPSQWIELEHQALIFKYITARVPIPPNLLLAIRRLLNPSTLYALSDSSLRSNHLGWEPFHLGCSGNLDPERVRCRRTDGKKWRCSRDAVADQKYCERHLNRGRHRSRKPVEGQTSRAIAGTASPKSVPVIATSSAAPETGNVSGSPAYHTQRQIETTHQSAGHIFCSGGSLPTNESKDRPGNTQNNLLLSSVNFKEKNSSSWPLKHHFFSHEWPHATGLDSILSDSLLSNADQRHLHSGQSKNFTLWSEVNARETQQENLLCPFTDQWLKMDETTLERSQFSITMPNQEHQGPFSLKSDREMDLFEMSVGMEASNHSSSDRQFIWAPQTWQTSLGGPLAEVLNSTRRTSSCKSSSALNLQMNQDWDSSLPVVSSPTAVLVKTEFCSHSNSSAGSSPRTETIKASDGRLPDDNALNRNPMNSVTIIKC